LSIFYLRHALLLLLLITPAIDVLMADAIAARHYLRLTPSFFFILRFSFFITPDFSHYHC